MVNFTRAFSVSSSIFHGIMVGQDIFRCMLNSMVKMGFLCGLKTLRMHVCRLINTKRSPPRDLKVHKTSTQSKEKKESREIWKTQSEEQLEFACSFLSAVPYVSPQITKATWHIRHITQRDESSAELLSDTASNELKQTNNNVQKHLTSLVEFQVLKMFLRINTWFLFMKHKTHRHLQRSPSLLSKAFRRKRQRTAHEQSLAHTHSIISCLPFIH